MIQSTLRGAPARLHGHTVKAVILGGREGRRRLDASRSQPLALLEARDRPVLDWIASALRTNLVDDLTYVGGYQLQKVMARYPDLAYKFHAGWADEGELAALRTGITVTGRDHLVLRGDTVLRGEAVERLLAAGGRVAAGVRHDPAGEAVLTGSLLIPSDDLAAVLALVDELVAADRSAGLDALVARLPGVERVDLTNLAAPVGEPASLVGTIFRGKARTLAGIAALTRRAVVLDQVRFTVADWRDDPEAVLAAVRGAFDGAASVVVRSSSLAEDGAVTSAAGRFDSVLDVAIGDGAALAAAIDHVVASYASAGRAASPHDEVLVQPHVGDLAASGVLFTRDLATGAPYFVLSVDRASGRSDVVTSGADGEVETIFASWAAGTASGDGGPGGGAADPETRRLLDLGRELMGLAYLDALDIEFGLARDGTIFLFQVRPLVAARRTGDAAVADEDLLALVACAREFVAERLAERPGVPGRRSLLGNMPDWNPAEMIGAAPRPLALSLYQRLVGDRAWSRARARMGYRDLEPEPLILAVGGRPYVDVRASLASFLPASLDDATAGCWIDACVDRIAAEPHLHDKIEFEITPTCLAFDWPDHAARMREAGLDEAAIERFREGLRGITAAQLEGGDASVLRELGALDRLAARRAVAVARPALGAPALGRATRDHLERCEFGGVEPFAVLARQAFIAMALLRSLVRRGALSEADASVVLRSIPTVASETAAAIEACGASPAAVADFVARYGHLRSNSYEITSPDYAASLDRVLGAGPVRAGAHAAEATPEQAAAVMAGAAGAIDALLAEAGLPGDAASLLAFVRAAIAARERAKFEFMKDLDLVLETCAAFGAAIGVGREDLSFVHIDELLPYATDSLTGATPARLRRTAGVQRKQALLTAALRLPDLIRTPDEVVAFRQERWKPNFVTGRRVVARAVALDDLDGADPDLDGAIVLVRAADPGYDWIFSHRIAGLVTEYGGMGSHMAIRAAEFDLPAAIGCGGAIFETLRPAAAIELDCGNGRVRPAPEGA